jgi:hypothetical protein
MINSELDRRKEEFTSHTEEEHKKRQAVQVVQMAGQIKGMTRSSNIYACKKGHSKNTEK